jgi:SHS2 domain-containing protein
MNKRFEFIEHTADVRVKVYGESVKEIFENAAVALFTLLTNHKSKGNEKKKIFLETQTMEDLLVNWLNELLSCFYTYNFLPAKYNIRIEDGKAKVIRGVLEGEFFSPYTHKINMEVKAATYHNLKIEKNNRGFKAEIIFDV